jgi:hypothetical protein
MAALELSYDNLEEESSDFWIEKYLEIDLPLFSSIYREW